MFKNRLMVAAAIAVSLAASSAPILQHAFAHGLYIQSVDVDGAGERQVTIVLGHTNEPTYGAKPGIHDGKHGLEVFLEDTATSLPLTGANLKVDKYYFSDFRTFERAPSVGSATEIQRGIVLGGVFGDPGHYMARQVQKDGIYGYRLYGNITYFGVADIAVDTTVFCMTSEGNTSKFNSPGWIGGFGCTENIDGILFPERNSNVNSGQGRVTLELPATNGANVQQASTTTSQIPAPSVAAESSSVLQLLQLAGIPAAAIAGAVALRRARHRKELL